MKAHIQTTTRGIITGAAAGPVPIRQLITLDDFGKEIRWQPPERYLYHLKDYPDFEPIMNKRFELFDVQSCQCPHSNKELKIKGVDTLDFFTDKGEQNIFSVYSHLKNKGKLDHKIIFPDALLPDYKDSRGKYNKFEIIKYEVTFGS